MARWGIFAFPVLLAVGSAAMLAVQWRAWKRGMPAPLDPLEHGFRVRQFRRRMLATGLLGVVAVALAVGLAIPYEQFPSVYVWYWAAVMLLVLLVTALALVDALSNIHYFRTWKRDSVVEQARLKAEYERRRRTQHNGHDAHK